MTDQPVYTEGGKVTVENGVVALDGPDHVHIVLTPDAAEQLSERLMTGVLKARGERFFNERR